MKVLKTREETADYLAGLPCAAFPLGLKRGKGAALSVTGGEGQILCRCEGDDAYMQGEAGRLERIIARLNAVRAAADNRLLSPSAAEAAQFQKAVRRAWAAKKGKDKIGAKDGIYAVPNLPRWSVAINGPKMKPSSVLDKAARLGLHDELALALFGRIVRAGIMPLALITYGGQDYDLRYCADSDKLEAFLHMPPDALMAVLSPEAEDAADLPERGADRDDETEDDDVKGRERALEPDMERSAEDKENSGFAEESAPLLMPPRRAALTSDSLPLIGDEAGADAVSDDDSDTEIFSEPPPHTLGTLKHKAVADKLCGNLSVVWPFGNAGNIYKFKNPIDFADSEEFSWGRFREDEVSYLNQALSDLQKATSILVEYRLPSKRQGAAERAMRIDVVAYYADTKTLKIIDWKFGRLPVPIDNNPQLNGYVQRLLADFIGADNGDKVKWIEISIVQPNSYAGETKRRFLNRNGALHLK